MLEALTFSTTEIEDRINIAINDALKAFPHNDNDASSKRAFKEAVAKLASLGALNEIIEENNTLLHFAIKNSSLFAVKCLLAKGANITLRNESGDNVLHVAVQRGHFEIVEEMLGVSEAANFRKIKNTWVDKDRQEKLDNLKSSQKKAWDLLNKPNQKNEIPLIIAANLEDDRIYKRLLKLAPHCYTKRVLDEVLEIRKKRIRNLKQISGWWAFLAALCPSASPLGIAGFIVAIFGFNAALLPIIVSISISIVMLPLIGFAYYQKNKFEKKAIGELERLQIELAFLQGIEKKVDELSSKSQLSNADLNELSEIGLANKAIIKPLSLLSSSNATAYMSWKDKAVARISLLSESLCAFGGALAFIGACFIPGVPLVVVITGVIIGLIVGAGIFYIQYKNRKLTYNTFREMRQSSIALQNNIYRELKKFQNNSEISFRINDLLAPQDSALTLPEPPMTCSQSPVSETTNIVQPAALPKKELLRSRLFSSSSSSDQVTNPDEVSSARHSLKSM